jgi:hypothetical protein
MTQTRRLAHRRHWNGRCRRSLAASCGFGEGPSRPSIALDPGQWLKPTLFGRSTRPANQRVTSRWKVIGRKRGSTCSWMPSPLRQSGLAETFEHVGVIPGPYPRRAPAEIHVEGRWRDRDGLF